jgi:hypothetical protein
MGKCVGGWVNGADPLWLISNLRYCRQYVKPELVSPGSRVTLI